MDRTHRSSPEGSQDSDLPAPRQWNRASVKSRAPGQAERWQKCLLAVLQQAHQYDVGPQRGSGWSEQRTRSTTDQHCGGPTTSGSEICTREGTRTLTPEGTRT